MLNNQFRKIRKFFLCNEILQPIFEIFLFSILLYIKSVLLFKEVEVPKELVFTDNGKFHTIVTFIIIGFTFYYFSSKIRKLLLWITFSLLSLVMYADILYYRHFNDFISFSLIYQVGQLVDVSQSVFDVIRLHDSLYFIDIVILYLVIRCFTKREPILIKRKISVVKLNVMYTFIVFSLFSNIYFSFEGYHSLNQRNSNALFASVIGSVNFHILDMYDFVIERLTKPELTEDKIKEIATSFKVPSSDESSDYKGIMEGKNLIMIQMESMSGYFIDMKIEGKEVTPHLNKLSKENYYASNLYKQIGVGHTSDAEYTILNSLYPIEDESIYIMYSMNNYYSLPSIFKEEGYSTFYAHGYRKEFWNRVNMYQPLGFEESYFRDNYEYEEKVGYGISDKEFFEQTVEKMTTLKEPFFSFLITLQHHKPFDVIPSQFNVGEYEDTEVGYAIKSAHEADKAIGVLMKELEEEGLLENSVLVFYGDHDLELPGEEILKLFPELTTLDYVLLGKVPFIISTPNKEIKGENTQPLGQIDIMPTILHLFGMESKGTLMYGENMFVENQNRTVTSLNDWYVGREYLFTNQFHDLEKAQAFDLNNKEEIPVTEEMIKKYEEYQRQLQYSESIIKTNSILKIKEYIDKELVE